jgi:hypothetical protein
MMPVHEMSNHETYTTEELFRIFQEGIAGREQEFIEAAHSKESLIRFLRKAGLVVLARVIRGASLAVYEGVKHFVSSLFDS